MYKQQSIIFLVPYCTYTVVMDIKYLRSLEIHSSYSHLEKCTVLLLLLMLLLTIIIDTYTISDNYHTYAYQLLYTTISEYIYFH